jgi:hypothetical protein
MEVKHSATVEGRRAYLEENSPSSITKNRMDSTFFMIRKDGQSHPMISAADGLAANCQLCRYSSNMSKRDQLKNAVMKNNRGGIKRCLQCNVNYVLNAVMSGMDGIGIELITCLMNKLSRL